MEHLQGATDYIMALRHTQIRASNWFNTQIASPELVPVPDFACLVRQILHREQWRPMQAPTNFARQEAPLPGRAPVAPQRTPPLTMPPATPEGCCECVTNVTYKRDFTEFKEKEIPNKTVCEAAAAAGKQIPSNAWGTEMCLSYHISGFCLETVVAVKTIGNTALRRRQHCWSGARSATAKVSLSEGGANGCC